MYMVKFYLLHGWLRSRNDGKFKSQQLSIPVTELSESMVYDYQDLNFKIENIEVIYDYARLRERHC